MLKLEIQLEFCVKQTEKEIDGEPRKEALVNAVHDAHRARRHHETRFFKYSTYLMSNCQKLSPKSNEMLLQTSSIIKSAFSAGKSLSPAVALSTRGVWCH